MLFVEYLVRLYQSTQPTQYLILSGHMLSRTSTYGRRLDAHVKTQLAQTRHMHLTTHLLTVLIKPAPDSSTPVWMLKIHLYTKLTGPTLLVRHPFSIKV